MEQVEDTEAPCIEMTYLCPSDNILSRKSEAKLFTDFVHRHRSDVRVFEQDKWFVNDNGEATLIDDLSCLENASIHGMMIDNADHFYQQWKRFINALALISKKCLDNFGVMYDIETVEAQTPEQWVRSTPLFQKIERNYNLMFEFVCSEYQS